jgi:hypothetical protein
MTIVASKPTITQVARDADVFRQHTEKLNLPVASSFSAMQAVPVE